MSLHLVTGYKGAAHITAEDHGALNACMFGNLEVILKSGKNMSAAVLATNTVRIYDGDLIMQGRHIRIAKDTYEDVKIASGTSGKKRNDLIVVRYTKDTETGIENVSFAVIKGTETTGTAEDPSYTTGDVLSGSCTLHEMPLYRIALDGVNVGEPERLARVAESFNDVMKFEDKTNGALYRDSEDYPKFGTLPLRYGGTGTKTDLDNAPPYAIIRKLKSGNYNQLYYTPTNKGAFYATAENVEANFGRLPVDCGGTGNDISQYPNGAILVKQKTSEGVPFVDYVNSLSLGGDKISGSLPLSKGGTGTSVDLENAPTNAIIRKLGGNYNQLYYTATGNGAFYATAENGQAKFGTLPVAQGGTGANNTTDALKNLGVSLKTAKFAGTAAWDGATLEHSYNNCRVLEMLDFQIVFIDITVKITVSAKVTAGSWMSVASGLSVAKNPAFTKALAASDNGNTTRMVAAQFNSEGSLNVKFNTDLAAGSVYNFRITGSYVVNV